MECIIYFILSFIIVYLISYLILVRKKDKYDKNKVPVEVEYLIKKYRLDMKSINYHKFLNTISIIGSIDMSLTIIIVFNIENIILQLLTGFIILIPLIIISFKLLAKYYIKKGYVKNERKNKQNRK